jgi:hypothetical protein
MEDPTLGLLSDLVSAAVVSHDGDGGNRRSYSLSPEGFLFEILRSHPEKLRITTLRNVWRAFWDQVASEESVFHVKRYYFDYDDRRWMGTLKRHTAKFGGKITDFVDIRLPNDGFLYTPDYLDNENGVDELASSRVDAVDWIMELQKEFKNCRSLTDAGFTFELVDAEFKYVLSKSAVMLRFFDAAREKCVSVNFHYGVHCGYLKPDTSGARFAAAALAYVENEKRKQK